MRIDALSRLGDRELISLSRWVGVATAAVVLALAVKAMDAPGDVWGGWNFLAYVVLFGPFVALMFFATERLREREERSQAPRNVTAAFIAGLVVVAVVATQEWIFVAGGENGTWAVVDVLVRRGLPAVGLFWLLTVTSGPLSDERFAVGVVAGLVFLVGVLALELRSLDHPFLDDGWVVISFTPLLAQMPTLLVVAGFFPFVPKALPHLVWVIAAVAIVASVAYSLKSTEFTPASAWYIPVSQVSSTCGGLLMLLAVSRVLMMRAVMAGALVVGAATLVWSAKFFVEIHENNGEPLWFGVTTVMTLLVMLVPPVLFSEVGRRIEERQAMEVV